MRFILPACALLALAAVSTAAKADNIVDFTLSGTGTIQDASGAYLAPGTATGGFTYDFTTNTVTNNTATFSNGTLSGAGPYFDPTELVPGTLPGGCDPGLAYFCETGTLDPTGGSFYFEYDLDFNTDGRVSQIYTGDITPTNPTSITPEPSSFALLGTGLLGVAGTLRRRFSAGTGVRP